MWIFYLTFSVFLGFAFKLYLKDLKWNWHAQTALQQRSRKMAIFTRGSKIINAFIVGGNLSLNPQQKIIKEEKSLLIWQALLKRASFKGSLPNFCCRDIVGKAVRGYKKVIFYTDKFLKCITKSFLEL